MVGGAQPSRWRLTSTCYIGYFIGAWTEIIHEGELSRGIERTCSEPEPEIQYPAVFIQDKL